MTSDCRTSHDILGTRLAAIPAALREAAAVDVAIDLPDVRRVVTTGIGSSRAHAKFLAHILDGAGVPARFVPTAALRPMRHDALVVFSQGLSPNARIALAEPAAWARVVLVTGVPRQLSDLRGPDTETDSSAARRAAEDAGARCVALAGGPERGTLLRLVGPMTGYVVAHRLAAAVARAAGAGALPALDVDRILERVAGAAARATALIAELGEGAVAEPLALLASGGYGELADNLSLKVLEGLLQPAPPVWDLLDFAHGPYQALAEGEATLLALARSAAPGEAALLERLADMLDPKRHRLVRLEASLPGPLAILEHEMQLDVLVLHAIAERRIDQAEWPAKGRERPLYDVRTPLGGVGAAPRSEISVLPPRRLDELTWPELEARIAQGQRTALVPLGATEQHGPHLPFATDTWIADALAARFCQRAPETIALAALPIGCSSEHGAFPGTLDLRATTLQAVLRDVVASLARHGFETIVVFSAHGGNFAALRAAARDLAAAAAPAEVLAFADLEQVVAVWQRAAAALGIDAAAAGHHAGELETSIMAGLRPADVRRERLESGLLDTAGNAQAVFYPSLRTNAPNGVVGDPRRAAPARADPYLAAWADMLVDWYRGAKNRK